MLASHPQPPAAVRACCSLLQRLPAALQQALQQYTLGLHARSLLFVFAGDAGGRVAGERVAGERVAGGRVAGERVAGERVADERAGRRRALPRTCLLRRYYSLNRSINRALIEP